MTPPLLCVDSDIFTLLAAAGRLHRAAELAGFPPSSLRRLPALPHQLARAKSFRDYPPAAKATALEAANTVAELTERATDDTVFQRLVTTPNIDSGEALLFAVMAEQPVFWLATGDVRSLTAMASPELDDIRQRVAGRVLSFEATFFALIQADGFEATAAAFADVGLSDNKKVRTLARPPGPDGPLAGVCSYLKHLCISSGGPGRLLHCPPCPNSATGACEL